MNGKELGLKELNYKMYGRGLKKFLQEFYGAINIKPIFKN